MFRFAFFLVLIPGSCFAQWDAPSGYYSQATGQGTTLKSQLGTIMAAGHIQRRYGDFRDSAAIHDQAPDDPSRIMLVYNGAAVSATWDSGNTWNREHVWPQSRQPGSASNSSRGNLGDPHALRPATPSVNSMRGNRHFGFATTMGGFGPIGSVWFPGDECRGDIARSLFYSETRYGSELGIELVNGTPSGNQMGDLASLVAWHYLDPPDEFERRRNHAIYSLDFNPEFFTNNRNAFVDRPEFVWSVYVNQQNDTQLTVDNGQIDFGSVIVGANAPLSEQITISKSGQDGTYYSISVFEDAASDAEGLTAFPISSADNRTINVSMEANQSTPGDYIGLVVVDNLDVTTGGGSDTGANDPDDFVDLLLNVLDHSNAAFDASSDVDSLTIDLGTVTVGQPIDPVEIPIHNLPSPFGAALTARLELASIGSDADDLSLSGMFSDLPAGQSTTLQLDGTPQQAGSDSIGFTITLADEPLPGATQQTLELTVDYESVAAVLLGDVNRDGSVDLADIPPFVELLSTGGYQEEADIDMDGTVGLGDIAGFIALLA